MRILTILAVLLLLALPAGAEPLLAEDGLSVGLTDAKADTDGVYLTLSVTNTSDDPAAPELVLPSWNDEPVFFDGWLFCVDILLEPGETRETGITIRPEGGLGEARSVSFRFCVDGRITSPARIQLADLQAETASFYGPEDLLFRETVPVPDHIGDITPVRLADSIPAECVPEVATAYVGIYLQEGNGMLRRLSRIPVRVDEDGKAEALWSGLYPALAGDTPFPVTAWETAEGNAFTWTTDRFSFYGEEIYYARADVEITLDENGARVTGQKVTAGEFNEAANIPFSLVEYGTVSALISRMYDRDGSPVPEECDADNLSLTIDAPLQLMLAAAEDPGRLVICFEYFFMDNSDIVHMVPMDMITENGDSPSGR